MPTTSMLLLTVFSLSALAATLPGPHAGQSIKSVWKRDEIDKWEGKGDKWEVEIGIGGGGKLQHYIEPVITWAGTPTNGRQSL